MDLTDVDIEGVEAFVRVAETMSFTEAGKSLGLPKSTVSRRLSRLEERLGVRLLHRTTRKLALTEAGSKYLGQVAPALAAIQAASSELGDRESELSGTVRVTAPFNFGVSFLGGLVARFIEKYPEIDVELALSDRLVDLIGDGYDMAFRGGRLEDSTLVARPLGRGGSWLVASPDYLARDGVPESVADLEKKECVLFRGHEGVERWTLEGPEGKVLTVAVSGRVNGDEYGFVRSATKAGAGIACIPWVLVTHDVASGALARVLPAWGTSGGQMHLVYPSARHLPSRVKVFRDFVLDWVKDPPWEQTHIDSV